MPCGACGRAVLALMTLSLGFAAGEYQNDAVRAAGTGTLSATHGGLK